MYAGVGLIGRPNSPALEVKESGTIGGSETSSYFYFFYFYFFMNVFLKRGYAWADTRGMIFSYLNKGECGKIMFSRSREQLSIDPKKRKSMAFWWTTNGTIYLRHRVIREEWWCLRQGGKAGAELLRDFIQRAIEASGELKAEWAHSICFLGGYPSCTVKAAGSGQGEGRETNQWTVQEVMVVWT